MTVLTEKFTITTKGFDDVIDISPLPIGDIVISLEKALQQAEVLCVAQNVDLPVSADVALLLSGEAQDDQQHLSGLQTGDLSAHLLRNRQSCRIVCCSVNFIS